jgi:hypothetical protein
MNFQGRKCKEFFMDFTDYLSISLMAVLSLFLLVYNWLMTSKHNLKTMHFV